MPNTWRWKVILLVFLTILSVYLLVPTLFGFVEKRRVAAEQMTELPWYMSIFPDKGINLGLDLQGGIYLEFEVDDSAAVTNKVDMIITDIKDNYEKNKIKYTDISQDTKDHSIIISGLDSGAKSDTISFVKGYFEQALTRKTDETLRDDQLAFKPEKQFVDNLRSMVVKQSVEKVRNRIDRYGVAEPSIQRLGSDRIAVELPGIKDPDRAIGIIKKAGQLEFKIVDETLPEPKLVQLISDARRNNNLPDDFSAETVDRINELLKNDLPKDTIVAFETQYDPVTKKITGGNPYVLNRKAEITGEMLKNASVDVQNNEPYVSLTFDAQGAKIFGDVTSENVGKRMAILLDGTVMKAPVIREGILGGRAQITLGYGSFADLRKEAEDLVLVLQEGALPARLTEATKTVVGPTLGADSIHDGIVATLLGAIVVCVFMLIYYRGSGLLANLALMFNLLFILSALALFQATLTLPGIAGIALTLGMAVDANVLIFERMREEIRDGKTPKAVIEAGYNNAMRAIIDSNLTTLIAGVVLYQFGTGPIKGFAVTLIIGLSVSMYTACVCTRMVYDYLIMKRQISRISV
jgi:protein-export membrane protein SecD